MLPDRASEIVAAINARLFATMDIGDGALNSLADISLADMIEAKRVVEQANEASRDGPREPGESYSISMVPDDRLIAAVYCAERFPVDGEEPILCLPLSENERFWNEPKTHKALIFAPVSLTEDDDDEI